MRKYIFEILKVSDKRGNLSWWFDLFLILLISLNVLAVILESVVSLQLLYKSTFKYIELVSVIIFTVEYILRIWSINEDERFRKLLSGNVRYAMTPLAIIDLLAILPFYLPLIGIDLRFLRILRLLRLFQLFKIARYIKAISLISVVYKEKKEELMISFVFTFFMLLITSSLMYYIENDAQPDQFSSIPQTMWWGIATLTTVGYGDIYPITPIGKMLGGIIAIIGIGLFALPTGILASGFSSQISKTNNTGKYCPHCGNELINDS